MPFVKIDLFEGRTEEQKIELAREVTEVVSRVAKAPKEAIHVFINDMPANFGSQGQHRSLILSLKMAEIELIKTVTGDYPILLLDDVMSELDNYRQTELLKMIIDKNVQTFITTTSLDHLSQLPDELKIFTVNQGNIQEN